MSADLKTVRILAIDGGGIRGILPARVLQAIEERTGRKARDLFDLIAGTSTGGIIACGLLAGKSAKELGDLYAERGGEIFQRSLWQRVSNPAELRGPKYSADTIDRILAEQLGEAWLGDTKGPDILVPTYIIELPKPAAQDGIDLTTTRVPYFFKSWKARGSDTDADDVPIELDFRLRDIARATSAAPTYFPPALITNRAGQKFAAVDGGVFANNPSICALSSAYKLYANATKFILLSLGTGSFERDIPYKDAKDWGDLQWLHPILSILMDGNADTVCYQCEQVLGDSFYRFEISLGRDPSDPAAVNEDFDDALPDNVKRLELLAKRLIDRDAQKLGTVCSLLTSLAHETPPPPAIS